jgi:hypothetical protein
MSECKERKKLRKARPPSTVGVRRVVEHVDMFFAKVAKRVREYLRQLGEAQALHEVRERKATACFEAYWMDGVRPIDVVVIMQDFAAGEEPDRAVCYTLEEQSRILVLPANELKLPFEVFVRDLEGKPFTVEKLTGATSVKGLKEKFVKKTGMRYWPMLKYGTHARLDDDAVLSAYGITKDATLEVTGSMLGGAALAGQSTAEANSFAAEPLSQATATAQQDTADTSGGATNGRTDGTPSDRATDLGLRMNSPSTAQRQGSPAAQPSSQAAGARCQSALHRVTRSPIALAQDVRPHHLYCS